MPVLTGLEPADPTLRPLNIPQPPEADAPAAPLNQSDVKQSEEMQMDDDAPATPAAPL